MSSDNRDAFGRLVAVEALLTWWGGFVPALVLTCAIELPVYLLGWASLSWIGRERGAPLRPIGAAGLAVLINLITHPLLWATARVLPELIVLLEVGVVAIEGLFVFAVIRRVGSDAANRAAPGWAWPVALGVNALSVLAGSAVLILIIDLASWR